VSGKNLDKLNMEAGGLRMQRVPPTEKRGRVHTSTVTVAVIDQSQSHSFEIDPNDLQVEWFSGTGKLLLGFFR
jgi:peptide chain release factor 1